MKLLQLIALLALASCSSQPNGLQSRELSPRELCPHLSGTYSEVANGRFDDGRRFVSHLMGNAFGEEFYSRRGLDMPKDIVIVRVSQSERTIGELEAIFRGERLWDLTTSEDDPGGYAPTVR